MNQNHTPNLTIARRHQRRLWLIAKINKERPSVAVDRAINWFFEMEEFSALERGYDDPTVSAYAEELANLIGFEMIDDDGDRIIPAHKR